MNTRHNAERDFHIIRQMIRGAKGRRSVPPWSLPAEVWHWFLWQDRTTKPKIPTEGIGASEPVNEILATAVEDMLINFHVHTHETKFLPCLNLSILLW